MLDQKVVRWVNLEAAKLRQQGWFPGSRRETTILNYWKVNRPQMFAQLNKAGIAAKMATVLDNRHMEAWKAYVRGGWAPTDAEEQAAKEWLIMEPEKESPSPPLFDRISTSTIPSD